MASGVGEALSARFSRRPGDLPLGQDTGRVKGLTPRVAAVAIVCEHKDASFDVPMHQGVARSVLNGLMRANAPSPTRALPLKRDCYLASMNTLHKPRWGRDGRMGRTGSACRRGALDVAMISHMRDARLRVSKAAALAWGDVERVRGGSCRVRILRRLPARRPLAVLPAVHVGSKK